MVYKLIIRIVRCFTNGTSLFAFLKFAYCLDIYMQKKNENQKRELLLKSSLRILLPKICLLSFSTTGNDKSFKKKKKRKTKLSQTLRSLLQAFL